LRGEKEVRWKGPVWNDPGLSTQQRQRLRATILGGLTTAATGQGVTVYVHLVLRPNVAAYEAGIWLWATLTTVGALTAVLAALYLYSDYRTRPVRSVRDRTGNDDSRS
jgi:hypothetical protein